MPEWERTTLGAIADVRFSNVDKNSLDGERPVRLCNYMDVYANDYVRASIDFMEATATEAEIRRFRLDAGDVILTKDSETPNDIGIPAVVEDALKNVICGYHLALLKPKRETVDSIFLAKQIASAEIANYFARRATGSTRYALSSRVVVGAPVQIAPLNEQRRVSVVLRTVDEAIEQTEALIAKMQQVKAGIMHDLFTRGVTPDGRLRPSREKAPHLYKDSVLGWIPKNWDARPLFKCVRADITYGIVQAGPHVDGGVPYIRTGDMQGETLERSGLLCTSTAISNAYKRSEVRSGEIVFAIRATIGKVLRVPSELDGANLTQGTARIAPLEAIDPGYLLWCLRSASVQKGIDLRTKGTTFSEITLGDLRTLPVPLPGDREEQELIACRLNQCEERVAAERAYVEKLVMQKSGLMHDLLSGRVRVKPSDGATQA